MSIFLNIKKNDSATAMAIVETAIANPETVICLNSMTISYHANDKDECGRETKMTYQYNA